MVLDMIFRNHAHKVKNCEIMFEPEKVDEELFKSLMKNHQMIISKRNIKFDIITIKKAPQKVLDYFNPENISSLTLPISIHERVNP